MTFSDRLNSPKLDYTQYRSGCKFIKYQQSQALTPHFESFWSIVLLDNFRNFKKFPELATLKGISSLTFLFGQTCCCCSVQNFCKNTLSWETFLPIRCKICCCYLNYNFKVLKKKNQGNVKQYFWKTWDIYEREEKI